MSKDYLEAGKIVATHALKGEMRLQPWSDDASFLKDFDFVYFDEQGGGKTKLLSAKAHGNVTLIHLEGIDNVEAAEQYRGRIVYIKKSDAHLKAGSFFVEDIIGLRVLDVQTRQPLGTVTAVQSYPANDVWFVKTESGEVLIPNIPDIVKEVKPQEGTVYVFKMKGLFENED